MEQIDYNATSLIEIVNLLDGFADSFSFVIRKDVETSVGAASLIDKLKPFLIKKEVVSEWPGTTLLDGEAKLYLFKFRKKSGEILTLFQNNIWNWVQPEFPEDISFYKKDIPILVSITHEKELYFTVNNSEVRDFLRIKGFI